MISFPKFEPDISEKILERGKDYFRNGYIQDAEVVDVRIIFGDCIWHGRIRRFYSTNWE